MKYWLFMFLSFCCAFRMMAVTVDGTLVVNKIKTGDSIYVYNGISKINRLVDRPRMLMRTEDYDMVNQLLGGIKWTWQRNGHVLKDGIFVEVKASDREVCGLYISSNRFTVMGGGGYSMQWTKKKNVTAILLLRAYFPICFTAGTKCLTRNE